MTTLKEYNNKFLEYLKENGRADATMTAYRKDIEQLVDYLANTLDIKDPTKVAQKDIEQFLNQLYAQNFTKKTVSRKINAIKTFARYLLDEGVIGESPAHLITHPKLAPSEPRILSRIEYGALRDAVKNDVRTKTIVEILLQLGLKISELAAIQLKHIDYSGDDKKFGSLYVPGTQTGSTRTVPLNNLVEAQIKEYLKIRPKSDYDHLFITKNGKPLLVRNIRSTLDRYFKLINLDDVTVNDLRNTFVAEQLRRGASVLDISRIAGHKRLTTTENYLKFIDRSSQQIRDLEVL